MRLSLEPPGGRLKVSQTLTCDAPRRRQDDPGDSQKFLTMVHSSPLLAAVCASPEPPSVPRNNAGPLGSSEPPVGSSVPSSSPPKHRDAPPSRVAAVVAHRRPL